jgi:hypothetical protein
MRIIKVILVFISFFNYIYSGPVVGGAACSACCAAVHASEAAFLPLYLGMVGKCVAACLENLVPGCPPSPTDPRDLPCLIAESLISFAPTA